MYLLDTNVLSELTRPSPDLNVVRFLHETDEDLLSISVITVAEISRGVALLPPGRKRSALEDWLSGDLMNRFERRVRPVDHDVATAWGRLMARTQASGHALHVMDGFIAATALAHGETLVTRNVRDFQPLGLPVLNPWDGSSRDPDASPA